MNRNRFLGLALILLLVVKGLALPVLAQTMRPEIRGTHGIVGAGRHYSVAAGIRILGRGGNAIDAGVATVLAAAVCEISHFGFGGEAPTIIYDAKSHNVVVINGQGTAPADAKPEFFRRPRPTTPQDSPTTSTPKFFNRSGVELPASDVAQGKVPGNGPLGATVPAVLDAMALALANYGTMSLGEVMQPAIDLAENGFPMYEYLRRVFLSERKNNEKYPDTMKTYYPGGRIPEVGEIFRQPNLAKTLKAIVAAEQEEFKRFRDRVKAIRAARDAFYKGEIGKRIGEAVQKAGGLLTTEDLAKYEGKIEAPVSTTYRGYEVFKAGFWNQSPVVLQTLNILEGFDLAEMGLHSTEYLHTFVEAMKLAYDDRDAFYGDPDFVRVPARGLLSKEYAAERRKLIDRKKAVLNHRPGDPWKFESASVTAEKFVPHAEGEPGSVAVGDTTGVNVVDKDGNLFSATPSSGWMLGGAFIVGDTGVPLSNRMQAFSLDEKSPNLLQGRKRPRTTLTPTIVLKDGKPFLAISTPGGDSQDQQILNVLLNIFDFQLPLQEAIEAPRINSEHMFASFDNHADRPGELQVESRIAPGVIDALRAKGHKVNVIGPFGMSTGITAVGVDPKTGTLRGGADVRRERYVMGW